MFLDGSLFKGMVYSETYHIKIYDIKEYSKYQFITKFSPSSAMSSSRTMKPGQISCVSHFLRVMKRQWGPIWQKSMSFCNGGISEGGLISNLFVVLG